MIKRRLDENKIINKNIFIMKLQIITISVLVFTLNSCKTAKTENSNNEDAGQSIVDAYWVLDELEGEKIEGIEHQNKDVGFQLNEEENQISGFSGCNNFNGTYVLEADKYITFSEMASTRMACPHSDFDENGFLRVFGAVTQFDIEGKQLKLKNEDGETLAIFKQRIQEDEGVTEKYWKMRTLKGKEVKMAENQEKEIHFILKTEENRVNGFSGCNSFHGTFNLKDEDKIEFSQMAGTMKACPDVTIDEHEILQVFEKANQYEQQDDKLVLSDEQGEQLAEFEAVYF